MKTIMLNMSNGSLDMNGGGLVKRLISQRNILIQPGLSFLDNSRTHPTKSLSMQHLRNISLMQDISCIINVENWSRWLLASPMIYMEYGSFLASKVLASANRAKLKL